VKEQAHQAEMLATPPPPAPSKEPTWKNFMAALQGAVKDGAEEVSKLAATGSKAAEKKYAEHQIENAKAEWGRKAFDLFMAGDMEAVKELAQGAEATIAPLREKASFLDEAISKVRCR